jgi:hypothetical protein
MEGRREEQRRKNSPMAVKVSSSENSLSLTALLPTFPLDDYLTCPRGTVPDWKEES